jgi:hypothetical protein
MSMKKTLQTFCLLASCLAAGASLALESRELTWEDLVPITEPFDDPFERLTEDQIYDLGFLHEVRNAGGDADESDLEDAKEVRRQLIATGVDVDGLLGRVEEIRENRRKRAEAIDLTLSGKTVRMGGYLLPLEYAEEETTEFLLVPYVGACIHVPPPPPNQIVHVRYPRGFKPKSLYTAVQVGGTMWARTSMQSLYLVDGTADIPVGYSLDATSVEVY